jgi:hypothetical protein
MDEYLIFSHVNDLGLEPLVDGVLGINPLTNFVVSLFQAELLDVLVIRWMLVGILLTRALSEPPTFSVTQQILRFGGFSILNTVVDQCLDVLHRPSDDFERFCLVEPDLFKVMPGVLLEDEASVPSQDVCLVEGTHDLIHEVKVVSNPWSDVRTEGLRLHTSSYLLASHPRFPCLGCPLVSVRTSGVAGLVILLGNQVQAVAVLNLVVRHFVLVLQELALENESLPLRRKFDVLEGNSKLSIRTLV